ncbi:ATP-dependent DNA ligase [Wallemia mellicola]|nr:ATP-dependent DNA ligase [Wallemia mellicola]TIB86293.1 ATP-dependent DNA ligase [Wallemia mellicola]TIB91087.1 ATP-dependent DNA ligase [Wallemia mellicola]TIC22146.1 ATP-dependent DNA ligase [Wallemia mellicola]TIC34416.1 ATP-dependent DNA ligase [Wallemia mellicola]
MADDVELAIKLSMESYKREADERELYQRDIKRAKLHSETLVISSDSGSDNDDEIGNTGSIHTLNASSDSFVVPKLDNAIQFTLFVQACVECSSTRSRIEITNILTNYLRIVRKNDPDALLPSLWLFSSQLGPPYEPNELGVGKLVLNGALKDVAALSPTRLKQLHNRLGDIGDVAFEATRNVISVVKPKPLTVSQVYGTFKDIATQHGPRSVTAKTNLVKKLLVSAKAEQARWLMRALVQNLRIGAVRTTLSHALARAFAVGTPIDLPSAEKIVRRVYARHPNYTTLVKALLDSGLNELEMKVPVQVGTPVQPMLGAITRSLADVQTRLRGQPFTSEAKLDGQRCQLHASLVDSKQKNGWTSPLVRDNTYLYVRLFSRRLEDMTEKYPDVAMSLYEIFKNEPSLSSIVLDAEIAAIDDMDNIRSFQELSNRSRKAVDVDEVKIRVAVFGFDCMLFNGETLLDKPFRERRSIMRTHVPPFKPSSITYAPWDHMPSIDDTGLVEISAFFEKCMTMKAEGIMVKLLDYYEPTDTDDAVKTRRKALPATYEPDKRAESWLKVKKDYLEDVGDSIDLVPIGAWHGMGRKNQFWSPILLGVYDDDEGAVTAVCKCMSGFSDAFYKAIGERYAEGSSNVSKHAFPGVIIGDTSPDVYFQPSEVWECRGADITQSPVYPAAKGRISDKGLSIRFPRFIRVREDKDVEQANTAADLASMYEKQQSG